jgi:uridine kinase
MPDPIDRPFGGSDDPSEHRVVEALRRIIQGLIAGQSRPVVIALDGPSGVGKSTVAQSLATMLPAVIVPSDDFFSAQLTDAEWDARTPVERARDAIDWVRLRRDAIEPLRAGRCAVWHPFDFAGGVRDDGSYGMASIAEQREPAVIILVEGAYSSRPELADLIDLTVLLDAPEPVRRARLESREAPAFLEAWHSRWDDAEAYYFNEVRPAESFDVVIDTTRGIADV